VLIVAGNTEGKIGGNDLQHDASNPCNDSEVRSLDGSLTSIIRQPWLPQKDDYSIMPQSGEGIVCATSNCGINVTGKSSLLATYADYVWQKYRKITLLYVSDGGGFGDSVEALIQRGIIWVWKLKTRGNPFETCAKASRGWWPRKMINPATGESSPSCSLAEPVKSSYTLFCPKGHVIHTKTMVKALGSTACPTCGVQTSIKNGSVTIESRTTSGFEQVGARCYDGLTSMQFWIMLELAKRVGTGELAGEKTALGGQIFDGEDTFGDQQQSTLWLLTATCSGVAL